MRETQRLRFYGRDGQDLVGILDRPTENMKFQAIFAHCFTCTKDLKAAVKISRALVEFGIGVFRFRPTTFVERRMREISPPQRRVAGTPSVNGGRLVRGGVCRHRRGMVDVHFQPEVDVERGIGISIAQIPFQIADSLLQFDFSLGQRGGFPLVLFFLAL